MRADEAAEAMKAGTVVTPRRGRLAGIGFRIVEEPSWDPYLVTVARADVEGGARTEVRYSDLVPLDAWRIDDARRRITEAADRKEADMAAESLTGALDRRHVSARVTRRHSSALGRERIEVSLSPVEAWALARLLDSV